MIGSVKACQPKWPVRGRGAIVIVGRAVKSRLHGSLPCLLVGMVCCAGQVCRRKPGQVRGRSVAANPPYSLARSDLCRVSTEDPFCNANAH